MFRLCLCGRSVGALLAAPRGTWTGRGKQRPYTDYRNAPGFLHVLPYELQGARDDLARAIVVVQHIEAVLPLRVVQHLDEHAPGSRVLNEAVDGLVDSWAVQTCPGDEDGGQSFRLGFQVMGRREV